MQPTGTLTNIAPGAGGIERHSRTLSSHQLLPGGRAAMLERCLQIAAQSDATADAHIVTVTLATHDVGHRVPTGYIDRHLILVVEAWAQDGSVIELQTGEVLPAAAGDLAALPGALFAKRLVAGDGTSPLPFWQADASLVDTRLLPDAKRVQTFAFAPAAVRFRVRLLYRRFWQQTRIDKHWPDDTLTVYDQSLTVRPAGASSSSATNLP